MIIKAQNNHLKDIVIIENQSFQKPWSYQSFLAEMQSFALPAVIFEKT